MMNSVWAVPVRPIDSPITRRGTHSVQTSDLSSIFELLNLATSLLQKLLNSLQTYCPLDDPSSCYSTPPSSNTTKSIENNKTLVSFYPNSTIIKKPNITLVINNTAENHPLPDSSEPPHNPPHHQPPIGDSSVSPPIDNQPVDVLQPITTRGPCPIFNRTHHPLDPLSIHPDDLKKPIQTNKFYANFFLGSQKFPAYLDPYVLTWKPETYSGITVSHVDDNQKY
ncbi:hypothetical protein PCK1_001389 [Pneumocystis canis]|nr:hypothetical protein PCK1_001389 [Pneumocystis canis]